MSDSVANSAVYFVCHGCGATLDAALTLPFRCPNAATNDDVDHLLLPDDVTTAVTAGASNSTERNPFLRYRHLLSIYRLARNSGLSDTSWNEIVSRLDESLQSVDGTGFRITPMSLQVALGKAAGISGNLWVKDETGNVSGSHKARHLMGVMLYLRVLEAARLPLADGLRKRRLAIASCGNAAMAAAVIARAADWLLDVFIPPDANANVVRRLKELGAQINVCERQAGEQGDPCFLRFREAVSAGAIPFGVQGTENGLAVEGGRTLAFEMSEYIRSVGQDLNALFVQVGGGALASALAQGFALAVKTGMIARSPKIFAVQTAGCAPLDRAWRDMGDLDLSEVAAHRSRFMWPWDLPPVSVAHGILDDETYDWLEIAKALRATGGQSLVAKEEQVIKAHQLACAHTSIRVSATGSAGLAGVLAVPPEGGNVAVIFSGVGR